MMSSKGIIPDLNINKTHPYDEFLCKPRKGSAVTKFKPTKDMIVREIKYRNPKATVRNFRNMTVVEFFSILDKYPLTDGRDTDYKDGRGQILESSTPKARCRRVLKWYIREIE